MRKHHILDLLMVLIISVFAFRDSFSLSLFGDDWLVLYIFKNQALHWSSYLSPYGPTYLLMGVIDKFFGLNPFPYFVASLFFRSLAAVFLYALIFFLTRNRLSAFATSSLWAVSEIGIESTNWVFNMNSYLGLSLFLIVVIFLLKYHETSKKLYLAISVPFFFLSVISVPVRMHGAFIVLFLMELVYLFSGWRGLVSLKKFFLINLIWFCSFLILSSWKVFGSGSGNFDTYIGKGLKENATAIQNGDYSHFLLPLTTIGNMLFTDRYMNSVQIPRVIYKTQNLSWMKSFLTPLWMGFSIILIILATLLVEHRKRIFFVIASSGLVFALAFTINSFVRNNIYSMSPNSIFLTLAGGAFIILSTLLIVFTKQKNIKTGLFLGLIWLVGFAAVPIIFTPLSYIPSSMRYLILPGVAIPIIVGLLFALTKSATQKILLLIIMSPIYIIQYSSTQAYFKNLLISRSEPISQIIWENILAKLPAMDPKKDYLFYFEPKNGNDSLVRDVITFGFIPRMIVYRKSPDRPGSLYVIEKREEFISAITDGEKLKAYNWGLAKKIDKNNAFAFSLESDNSLTDIKSQILYGNR